MNTHVNPRTIGRRETFTDLQKERVRILVAEGKTDPEIGALIGHPAKSVQKLRNKLGILTANPAGRRWTDDELETMAEMYERGLSDAAIGEALDRASGVVGAKRRELGMNRRESAKTPAALRGLRPCPIHAEHEERVYANAAYLLAAIRAGHPVYHLEALPALYRERGELA